MTKQVIYKYLGTNGTLETPVHLEDIYYVRSYNLYAGKNKKLTNGTKVCYSIRVNEDEVNDWYEIDA